ncbi:RDD family protein [Promicromonospora sp. NPDC023987]|uniref:RDD family protein n=1 Tax=Promicromonospora sp. NPDC023987 TaxID=3155360 RepID=UPI00340C538C
MTDVVCAGCGSTQDGGIPYCSVCGRPFPRAQQGDVGTTVPESLSHTRVGVSAVQPEPVAYAGTGRRFLAALLDGAVIGVVAWVILMIGLASAGGTGALLMTPEAIATAMTVPQLISGLLALGYWLGVSAWEGKTGKTVGNLVCKIRTVDAVAHDPIGFGRAFLRWLIVGLGSLVCLVGQILVLVSPAFDGQGKRQGWHDKLGRAVVLMASDVAGAPAGAAAATATRSTTGTGARPAAGAAAKAPTSTSQVWTGAANGAPAQQAPAQQAQPAAPAQDPWAFPESSANRGGAGVITGIPGQAPGAPTEALPPQEEPVTVRRPHPGSGGTPHPGGPTPPPVQQQPVQQTPPVAPVAPVRPVQPAQPDLTQRAPLQAQPAQPVQPVQPVQQPEPEQRDSAPIDMTRTHMSRPLAPAPVTTVVLEVENGERYVVDTKALVGRNPQAPDTSGWILIKVEDPTRSVSKTHAELGVDTAGLWLTDRGSTNGTVVSAPGLPPRVAEPGARVRVPVGSTIHVGDRRVVVHPQASA